jgi:hypothetical protein
MAKRQAKRLKGVGLRAVRETCLVKFESCLPDLEGRGGAREKRAFRGLRHCWSHFRRKFAEILRRICGLHCRGDGQLRGIGAFIDALDSEGRWH